MSVCSTAVLLLALGSGSAPPATTHAASVRSQPRVASVVYYRPGVMQAVKRVRIRQGYSIPANVDGYASRPDCGTIGSVFYLKIAGYSRVFRLAQIDCSQYRDRARHERVNQVEVGWNIAVWSGLSRDGRRRGLVWEQ